MTLLAVALLCSLRFRIPFGFESEGRFHYGEEPINPTPPNQDT